QLPEPLLLGRGVLAADLRDDTLHDQHDDEHVEEDARLDDRRQAIGRQDREGEDPVLEHEEAQGVAERVVAGHAEVEADERHGDGAGEHGEQRGLDGEEVEPSRPALTPDEEQRRGQTQEREEIRGGGHGTRNTAVTERSASANEPARSSGTRKSRSLATTVSRTASAAARTASLPARARSPRRTGTGSARLVTPQGTKRLARSVMKTNSRIADAHPTR